MYPMLFGLLETIFTSSFPLLNVFGVKVTVNALLMACAITGTQRLLLHIYKYPSTIPSIIRGTNP